MRAFNFKEKLIGVNGLTFEPTIFKLTLSLIFLYPLFGTVVRNWFSGFASIIVIVGISYVIYTKIYNIKFAFSRDEIKLNVSIFMLFISYLVSGFINGWNENQLEFFAGEFNFALFVPLYVLVRNTKNSAELLIKGTILSGVLISLQFIYQIFVLDADKVTGPYGHLFIGPVAVLIAFISITSYKWFSDDKLWRLLIIFSVISSLITAAYSGSGTAYILVVVLISITPFIIYSGFIKRIVFVSVFYTCIVLAYFTNPVLHSGVNRVFESVIFYSALDDNTKATIALGTVGTRIELWIAGVKIFNNNKVFGVGRNNFKLHTEALRHKGIISQNTFNYSTHPHNIYIETLISKGLFGFIILMIIIYLIFKNYLQAKKYKVRFSDSAILHLFFILIVGVGSEAPLIKNNFLSIFLLYSAVFFSHNVREINALNEKNHKV